MTPRGGLGRGLAVALVLLAVGCRRRSNVDPVQELAAIEALERERDTLRLRLEELTPKEGRFAEMPATGLRVGVPTALARDLIEHVIGGFVDQVTIVLVNLHVRKEGSVKKVVTLGEYTLDVNVDSVQGSLRTGKPAITFGGNQVSLAMPLSIAKGAARATIHFVWNGKSVGGMVCGDLDITREVSGSVKPATYPVKGTLVLSATATEILATPRFPRVEVRLEVEPSKESWAEVQKVLDDKEGVCGYVLDKVDVLAVVHALVAKGFEVRLPTEKLKAMRLPVGVQPSMVIRGKPVTLAVKVGGFAITPSMIWLGADVTLDPHAAAGG